MIAAPGIVLASSSPRRRDILNSARIAHTVVEPVVEELPPDAMCAYELCEENACRKAKDVWERLPEKNVVLGADTLVVLDGKSLGKPRDLEEGKRMLRALSGRWHQVVTGICLMDKNGRQIRLHDTTDVEFLPLAEHEIVAYQRVINVLDKAGGYAMQGEGGRIVKQICGSKTNVIGLPIERLTAELKVLGLI